MTMWPLHLPTARSGIRPYSGCSGNTPSGTPHAQVFPHPATTHWPKEIAGREMDTYHRWMEVVIPGTLSGCPVVNVPAGFNERGQPMGLQIIGRRYQDFETLQIAYAYEQATRWTWISRRSTPRKSAMLLKGKTWHWSSGADRLPRNYSNGRATAVQFARRAQRFWSPGS